MVEVLNKCCSTKIKIFLQPRAFLSRLKTFSKLGQRLHITQQRTVGNLCLVPQRLKVGAAILLLSTSDNQRPTSSPGSSRLPIWRRLGRRPWHTAGSRVSNEDGDVFKMAATAKRVRRTGYEMLR